MTWSLLRSEIAIVVYHPRGQRVALVQDIRYREFRSHVRWIFSLRYEIKHVSWHFINVSIRPMPDARCGFLQQKIRLPTTLYSTATCKPLFIVVVINTGIDYVRRLAHQRTLRLIFYLYAAFHKWCVEQNIQVINKMAILSIRQATCEHRFQFRMHRPSWHSCKTRFCFRPTQLVIYASIAFWISCRMHRSWSFRFWLIQFPSNIVVVNFSCLQLRITHRYPVVFEVIISKGASSRTRTVKRLSVGSSHNHFIGDVIRQVSRWQHAYNAFQRSHFCHHWCRPTQGFACCSPHEPAWQRVTFYRTGESMSYSRLRDDWRSIQSHFRLFVHSAPIRLYRSWQG